MVGGLVDIFVSMYLGEHFPGGRGFRDFAERPYHRIQQKNLENQSEGHLETVFLVHDVETRNCPQNLLKSMLILQNQRGLRGRHAVFY